MSFNSSGSAPTLALGIAHNYGAIWDLSWCPSGTWEPKLSTKKQVWYRYIIVSQYLNSNIRCLKMFQWNIRISCVVTIWPKVCKTNAQGCKMSTSGWRAPTKNGFAWRRRTVWPFEISGIFRSLCLLLFCYYWTVNLLELPNVQHQFPRIFFVVK